MISCSSLLLMLKNSHKTLQELSKVGIGLVVGDLLALWYLYANNITTATFLGVSVTSLPVLPIVLFDLALIALLAHYAWRIDFPVKSPTMKVLLILVGVVFGLVAIAHFLRIVLTASVSVGSVIVPLWVSWIGVIVTAYLSYSSFHFALRKK